MRDIYTLKINFTGGIVSPGELQNILLPAHRAGVKHIRFGLRQQLIMDVFHEDFNQLKKDLEEKKVSFEVNNDVYPNIVSSYAAEEAFSPVNWLTEGIYKDIFDVFDYQPKLKINICDNNQSFTPFFTGNLNFIASTNSNFWHLYIRFPKTNLIFAWKELIYNSEISHLSKIIENLIFENKQQFYDNETADGEMLYEKVKKVAGFISKPIEGELTLPPFQLPYYEGINRYGNKSWLGIYRRDETFSIPFLNEICNLCLQTKIGQICITNWKSLIIKEIQTNDRQLWSRILGKYQINVRHAASELNWQIEDHCKEGLSLKQELVNYLSEKDIRTFGLSFAIQTMNKSELFGSVIIRKKSLVSGLGFLSVYDILHTEDFNPNSRKLVIFEKNLLPVHLGEQIRKLCMTFYHKTEKDNIENIPVPEEKSQIMVKHHYHTCKHCYTVYDEKYGDIVNGILPGVAFEELPTTFVCPVCEASKEDFEWVEGEDVILN